MHNFHCLCGLLGTIYHVICRSKFLLYLFAVAEWIARLLTVRKVSRLNPSILPLLHMSHIGNVTGCHAGHQSAGVAPEMYLRNSLHASDKALKRGIHPGFETQERRHQKSKTGVSVAPQKGLMSSKKFLKKIFSSIKNINLNILGKALHFKIADRGDIVPLAVHLYAITPGICPRIETTFKTVKLVTYLLVHCFLKNMFHIQWQI